MTSSSWGERGMAQNSSLVQITQFFQNGAKTNYLLNHRSLPWQAVFS